MIDSNLYAWALLPALIFMARGEVKVVFTIVPRREVVSAVDLIKKFNPRAFYSIEEVGFVEKVIFPAKRSWRNGGIKKLFRPFRKGK